MLDAIGFTSITFNLWSIQSYLQKKKLIRDLIVQNIVYIYYEYYDCCLLLIFLTRLTELRPNITTTTITLRGGQRFHFHDNLYQSQSGYIILTQAGLATVAAVPQKMVDEHAL